MIATLILGLVCQGAPHLDAFTRQALRSIDAEDCVYLTGAFRERGDVLPDDLALYVSCLGSPSYLNRDRAARLIRRHPDGVRAAYWAYRSADPHVSEEGLGLLRRFLCCPHCAGRSACPNRVLGEEFLPYARCGVCEDAPFGRGDFEFGWNDPRKDAFLTRCLNCDGTGSLLYLARPTLEGRAR
jgi:hypothetical protein